MTQNTVQLVQDPNTENEEILIAVGSSGEENASGDEIEVEWEEGGMLRIRLPSDKRRLPMKCVVNGSWDVGDDWGRQL